MTACQSDGATVVAVRVTTLTVRKMDDAKARLRVQATLSQEPVSGTSLVEAMRARVAPLGGVVLDLPEREVLNPWGASARP